MAEDLLAVAGLTVRYGSSLALDRLDLTIQRNELFVLLGASGSGKTTLLRAMAGFVRPEAGRIILDGADMTELPPHRRPVNTMFQSYALFPHMSVAANIGFGLRQQGASRAVTAQRVTEMLSLVRLSGFERRRPGQLSGGQQQRVALARSLAPHPSVLLLDEPLSALDQGLRMETRAELVRLRRELGISFVLVTHDQDEALEMGDRIGVMRDGRMEQIGTPAELYERPENRFVATFVGAANILPCVVAADGFTVGLPGPGVSVRAARAGRPGPGWLALRAERLRIGGAGARAGHGGEDTTTRSWPGLSNPSVAARNGIGDPDDPRNKSGAGRDVGGSVPLGHPVPQGAENAVDGIVTDFLYAGDALGVSVALADGTVLRVKRPLADGLDAARMEPGAAVRVSWQPDACILLPE